MKIRSSLLIFAMLIATSCGASIEEPLAKIVEVSPAGWHTPAQIPFEVSDTTSLFEVEFMVRYDSYISADSIELLVSTIAPDSVMWSEPFTINIPPAEHALQVTEKSYRRSIKWGQTGEYTISLHPMHIYRGVSAVGVKIIESK